MTMHNPKRCIFFDFHTMPACPDVGKDFDFDRMTGQLKDAGVDFIVFPVRCNLGVAYYNTKVGIRHPSLTYDLWGKLSEACQERGIAISAYINLGLSHEEALLHREWSVITPEGYTYLPDRMSHWVRSMCYNTGYADHAAEMVREVASNYRVAGFFFDCIRVTDCVCVDCVREMKRSGIDWKDSNALNQFSRMKEVRFSKRLAELATSIKPDLLLYFNGIDYEDQHSFATHYEFECLPTGDWGYELLPVQSRYFRTLGKTVLNMTGRFHRSWGDFGGIRTQPSLEYDLFYGIANAMRSSIGDHFHPRGDINQAVFAMYKTAYARLQPYDPWLDGAKALVDAAVVYHDAYPFYRAANQNEAWRTYNTVKAATRALCELKQQFDVCTKFSDWQGYKLLVLPDFISLDATSTEKVRKHLQNGGKVLATAWSGLDPEKKAFVLQEWGVEYQGDDPFDPAFIGVGESLATGMPEMPVTLYERGVSVSAAKNTNVLAHIIAPYYNRHWDGEHGFVYLPPDKVTDRPAATLAGAVGYFSHPIFYTYYKCGFIPMRQLVANMIEKLLPDPMVHAPGLPSFARVTVTSQPGRRMVHVLSYVPERRGETAQVIEEPIELRNVTVELRLDGRVPRRVYLAPTNEKLTFEIVGGYAKIHIPVVPGYLMVVFEEE